MLVLVLALLAVLTVLAAHARAITTDAHGDPPTTATTALDSDADMGRRHVEAVAAHVDILDMLGMRDEEEEEAWMGRRAAGPAESEEDDVVLTDDDTQEPEDRVRTDTPASESGSQQQRRRQRRLMRTTVARWRDVVAAATDTADTLVAFARSVGTKRARGSVCDPNKPLLPGPCDTPARGAHSARSRTQGRGARSGVARAAGRGVRSRQRARREWRPPARDGAGAGA